ncbi:MAG: YpdA family putative bacillithiol disulfide reductase [Gemmatimonadota bacterium]
MTHSESTSLLVIGSGPCGLAVGIAAQHAGISCLLLDRRTAASTIERYPLNMTFFSTPERIEIGGVPLISSGEKPTRREGLVYYRRVAAHFELDIRPGEEATSITPGPDGFEVAVKHRHGTRAYQAGAVVVATGYFDQPNSLNIPGENLPHVQHYFLEGHRHWRQNVVVIGAGNSGVDAALECWRAGAASVTMVHFGKSLDPTIKAWVLPDITNRIKDGTIGMRWNSRVTAITEDDVEITGPDGKVERLPADAVLAMTGYHPDTRMLKAAGVPVDAATGIPQHDERTMMTPVTGIYLAGVIASGNDANRLFIENARGHGELIVADLKGRLGR